MKTESKTASQGSVLATLSSVLDEAVVHPQWKEQESPTCLTHQIMFEKELGVGKLLWENQKRLEVREGEAFKTT